MCWDQWWQLAHSWSCHEVLTTLLEVAASLISGLATQAYRVLKANVASVCA